MAKISHEASRAVFEAAERCYFDRALMRPEQEKLHTDFGLNVVSANAYINNYKYMRRGDAYKRAMNGYSTDHFLAEISKRNGNYALSLALKSVRSHIDYYERLGNGNLNNIREIVAKFSGGDQDAALIFEEFQIQVTAAMKLKSTELRNLANAQKGKPEKKIASITVYKRNPYVAAEALLRADGTCESCGKSAPFKRLSDGTPYLEVHHKQRLADDGEDTIENVLALCPNCHRKSHFGLSTG
jgi:5-methylcytosine-specific restriction enzyme A